MLFFELGNQPVDDALVDVIAAQVGVAVGRDNLNDFLAYFQDRDVKGSATKVVHRNQVVFAFVESIRQSCSGWLVDDALYIQTGDATGVLGCLTLGIVEVSRNGDDGFGHFFAQILFGGALQLGQDLGRDFLRRVALATNLDGGVAVWGRDHLVGDALALFAYFVVLATDEALD